MNKEIKMFSYMLGFFLFASVLGYSMGFYFKISSSNIAVIKLEGEISPYGYGNANSDDIIELIKSAETNPNIKAIILAINSPGGSVVTTQEIVDYVKKCSKPVVAWIRAIGTSGAYWIASSADKIVASPLSITGSIGVSASYLEFSKLFEKYGITYVNLSYPSQKDILSQYRNITKEEKEYMFHILNTTYWYFVSDVAENRNMSISYVINNSRNGTILLGLDAYKKGFVDYMGGYDKAIGIASELGNIDNPKAEYFEKTVSLFDFLSFAMSFDRVFGLEKVELKT